MSRAHSFLLVSHFEPIIKLFNRSIANRCEPIPEVANSFVNTRMADDGTTVIYTCLKGYQFPNQARMMSITCTNKQWTNTPPNCESMHFVKILFLVFFLFLFLKSQDAVSCRIMSEIYSYHNMCAD